MGKRNKQSTSSQERLYIRKKTPATLIVFIIVILSLLIGIGKDRAQELDSPIVID